jgi:hypothetical protein
MDDNPTPTPTETNNSDLSEQELDSVSGGTLAPVRTVTVADDLTATVPLPFTGNIAGA